MSGSGGAEGSVPSVLCCFELRPTCGGLRKACFLQEEYIRGPRKERSLGRGIRGDIDGLNESGARSRTRTERPSVAKGARSPERVRMRWHVEWWAWERLRLLCDHFTWEGCLMVGEWAFLFLGSDPFL